MAVTGGIKFFESNKADSLTGTTATASSGDPSAKFILDKSRFTVWRSVGSNDATGEAIVITFPVLTQINRIFLLNHNWKEYTVFYLDEFAVPFEFTNVISVNGATSTKIDVTGETLNSSYFEFDTVSVKEIAITIQTTQIPNQEKFLNQFTATEELGTLVGFPIIKNVTKDKNSRESKVLNGRVFVQKSIETFRFFIDFKNYPPLLNDDLDLIVSLFDRDNSFFVWLSGGREGTDFFKHTIVGFRIQDLILVQVTNIFKDRYRKNIYTSMVDMKLTLEESV